MYMIYPPLSASEFDNPVSDSDIEVKLQQKESGNEVDTPDVLQSKQMLQFGLNVYTHDLPSTVLMKI